MRFNKGDDELEYEIEWDEVVLVGSEKCNAERELKCGNKFGDKCDCDGLDTFMWVRFDNWPGIG